MSGFVVIWWRWMWWWKSWLLSPPVGVVTSASTLISLNCCLFCFVVSCPFVHSSVIDPKSAERVSFY